MYGRSLALAVQCETTHGVYDFRRGFGTLVLSLLLLLVKLSLIQNGGENIHAILKSHTFEKASELYIQKHFEWY